MSDLHDSDRHSHNPLVRYFRILGPGLVTGAADDDPSGITTYSVAGASLGYGMLWMALATFPLMAAVQLICARIGLVTGSGLAAAIRRHYPRPFLYVACLLLLVANVFNIAADLAGMADVTHMLTGVPALVSVPVLGLVIMLTTIYTTYATFAQYLKWLTATLFAYVVTAFLARPDWRQVAAATLVPRLSWDSFYLTTALAVLGTTISPYLFFWQASHEVEQEKAQGRSSVAQRRGATAHELADARLDVVAGMALNLGGTHPIRMLFLSAVLNGLLAPPLLLLVMLVGNNRAIMGQHANGPWLNLLGWLATAVMFLAAVAFFATAL